MRRGEQSFIRGIHLLQSLEMSINKRGEKLNILGKTLIILLNNSYFIVDFFS